MSKELKNLRTNLSEAQYPEDTSRGIWAKARNKSQNRESGEPEELDMESFSISAGRSKGETVSKLKFSDRQSYTIVWKASEEEKRRADIVTFVQWMLDIYNNRNDKKEEEKNYHKKCSHLMEEV